MLIGALIAVAAAGAATTSPEGLSARAYLLVDHQSGAVVAERNADLPLEPASVTKVMTAWVVFSALEDAELRLDEMVMVSANAWRTSMGTSRTFLEPDRAVTVEVLLKGLLIQSGNDASIALAERLSGTEEAFAERMNRAAADLGMNNSHFANSNGLPSPHDHHTTARDLTILARALIARFPHWYSWVSHDSYTHNDIIQYNRNRLLELDPSVDGIKTGWTEAAGYCIVASAKRDWRRLSVAVLGAATEPLRVTTARTLLDFGFERFETVRMFPAHIPLRRVRLYKGTLEQVYLGLSTALFVTVPRGRSVELDATFYIDSPLVAPLAVGASVGAITVRSRGETLAQRELITFEGSSEGSLWRRTVDNLRLWAN